MKTEVNHCKNIFHLAIPAKNLTESSIFYSRLGAKICRSYHDHITINFFKHQLVIHLNDNWDRDPKMYPRHFGVNVISKQQWERVYHRAMAQGLEFYQKPFERFEGKPEHHFSFFLKDPSNNLLEFKHYTKEECNY